MSEPNRFVCDVLEELRKLYETRNFSSMLGLIEEAQWMVRRMEAGLWEKMDYQKWHEKVKREKGLYKKLKQRNAKLKKKRVKDDGDDKQRRIGFTAE